MEVSRLFLWLECKNKTYNRKLTNNLKSYIIRFTKNINKMVAHAANSYFTNEDIEMIYKVKDVKKWSPRMERFH